MTDTVCSVSTRWPAGGRQGLLIVSSPSLYDKGSPCWCNTDSRHPLASTTEGALIFATCSLLRWLSGHAETLKRMSTELSSHSKRALSWVIWSNSWQTKWPFWKRPKGYVTGKRQDVSLGIPLILHIVHLTWSCSLGLISFVCLKINFQRVTQWYLLRLCMQ